MRLYRNLVEASITALQQIFNENQLADRVVQETLRSNKKWGSKDRRFLANTIYEMVRWYRLYYEVYGKIPQSEADWWAVLGIMWLLQGEELPDWDVFQTLKKEAVEAQFQQVASIRKIKEAIPDWLDALGEKELGTQWDACLQACNLPAALVLRTNTLQTTRQTLVNNLHKKGVQAELLGDADAILIPERSKITDLDLYQQGHFEIQDASSQLIAPLLDVQQEMTIVDACAGAGGKSLHIAALMQNKGKITSLDVSNKKLKQLQERAKRASVSIIKTQVIQSDKTIALLYNSADRLLLDVPCSGLGTLRRSPHIKWRLEPSFLEEIKATQQEILQSYSPICKVGGKMVYATCSILPSENQQQVQHFLQSEAGKDFVLIQERAILPQEEGFDGFYMALLERIS